LEDDPPKGYYWDSYGNNNNQNNDINPDMEMDDYPEEISLAFFPT